MHILSIIRSGDILSHIVPRACEVTLPELPFFILDYYPGLPYFAMKEDWDM